MEAVFSVMKKAEKKEEVICESCSKRSSIAFCKQCRHYICEKCAENHKEMAIFSGHGVVSISSLLAHFKKSGASRVPIEAQELKCHKHTIELLKLYCYTCHQLVCRDCTLIDHKEHKYAFIVDAAPKCKSAMKAKVDSLHTLSSGLIMVSKMLNESEKKLLDHNAATMKAIDNACDGIVLKVQEKKKQLKAAAAQRINSSQAEITAQMKNVDLSVGEVSSLYDFLSRNLERATDQELFSLLKQMSDQAERAAQLYADPPAKFPVPTLPQLEVHCSNRVLQVLQEDFCVSERISDEVEDERVEMLTHTHEQVLQKEARRLQLTIVIDRALNRIQLQGKTELIQLMKFKVFEVLNEFEKEATRKSQAETMRKLVQWKQMDSSQTPYDPLSNTL